MKLKKATSYALHAMMYMTRHLTQLPVSIEIVSKAEGVPHSYLSRIFKKLDNAGIIRASEGRCKEYEFVKSPGEITLMEIFKVMEEDELFDDCFMKHCDCGGTVESCYIYSAWHEVTRKMSKLLKETSLADATWNHPEHRFGEHPFNNIFEDPEVERDS